MEHFRKLAIPIMTVMVAWSEPLTCQAQGPPAATGSIPPPRAFAASQPGAIAISPTSPAQPEPTAPAVGPVVGQRGANLPAPLAADADRSAPTVGLDQTFKLKAAPLESTDLHFQSTSRPR